METTTFKKNSWHYRLANVYGKWDPLWDDGMYDICSYGRKVAYGALRATILTAILGFVGSAFTDFGMFMLITGSQNDFFPPHFIGFFGFILSTLIALFCIIGSFFLASGWLIWRALDWFMDLNVADRITDMLTKCNSTFLGALYRSYKDKICFRINFK